MTGPENHGSSFDANQKRATEVKREGNEGERKDGGGVFKGRKYRRTKIVSVRAESKEC